MDKQTQDRNKLYVLKELRGWVAQYSTRLAIIEAKGVADSEINWDRDWVCDTRVRTVRAARAEVQDFIRREAEYAAKLRSEGLIP